MLASAFSQWLTPPKSQVPAASNASPAFHAAQYLLGNLDKSYLPTLREYKGLQAYPSRTKDPDPVDFSTGSVGLGAVAPVYAALASRYAQLHFGDDAVNSGRFIALMGDAEGTMLCRTFSAISWAPARSVSGRTMANSSPP